MEPNSEEKEASVHVNSTDNHNTMTNAYRRSLLAFWILGVTNNYAYVIMLSAAEHILTKHDIDKTTHNSSAVTTTEMPDHFKCNTVGTGVVLLADVIPSLCVKLTVPFYMDKIPYWIRITIVAACTAGSFIIVALANSIYIGILGVVICSAGSGLGESTFLALTSFYHKNTISSWSSGTGMAGIAGSLSYAGLRQAGVSASTSLYIMLFVPALLLLAYFILLPKMELPPDGHQATGENTVLLRHESDLDTSYPSVTPRLGFLDRMRLIRPLLCYMVPLFAVYVAEYFINQALFELLYFKDVHVFKEHLSQQDQYRWYQADYQVGVFISRSSIILFQIRKLWSLSLLQWCVLVVLLVETLHPYISSIWIAFSLIMFEGLLGGATYVNAFFRLSEEVGEQEKEFSMAATSMADSFGITLAGFIAIPVHNAICNYRLG